MDPFEVEKAKIFSIDEILEYISNSVVTKTLLKKTTGHVRAVSFDSGQVLNEKISPFDKLIIALDGAAEIIINDKSNHITAGQSIIIPAHARNTITASVRFKMISTMIKSGYEELS
jgi:quercetin dioxygenase-like cupin family protein